MNRFTKLPPCLTLAFLALSMSAISGYADNGTGSSAVLSANSAFYSALSSMDINKMNAVWANGEQVAAIHPNSTTIAHGSAAVKASWVQTFEHFSKLSVTMSEPIVKVNGNTAWVTGIETAQTTSKDGTTSSNRNFGTNIYEKQDGGWKMVFHSATRVPK